MKVSRSTPSSFRHAFGRNPEKETWIPAFAGMTGWTFIGRWESRDALRNIRRRAVDLFHKLEKMKVLLIDDDEAIRSSLRFYFGAMGRQIRVVQSAEEGLEALKGERYDIILCDYQLPGMNGLEFFKVTNETCPYSLRVLITAYASDEVAAEAARIGVHELIEKPLSIEIIEASIERLSQSHQGLAESTANGFRKSPLMDLCRSRDAVSVEKRRE
jgi:CheY-like chemotaxis protein